MAFQPDSLSTIHSAAVASSRMVMAVLMNLCLSESLDLEQEIAARLLISMTCGVCVLLLKVSDPL